MRTSQPNDLESFLRGQIVTQETRKGPDASRMRGRSAGVFTRSVYVVECGKRDHKGALTGIRARRVEGANEDKCATQKRAKMAARWARGSQIGSDAERWASARARGKMVHRHTNRKPCATGSGLASGKINIRYDRAPLGTSHWQNRSKDEKR